MSSMYRIREQMKDFTVNERRIAEFVLEHKEVVESASVQDIAERIGVSAASIVRFSKKAGFKGFSDMKVSLAKDHESSIALETNFIIDGTESFDGLISKARLSSLNTVDMTYRLLDLPTLKLVSEKVVSARKIFVVGVGGSGIIADDFYQKLTRINKDVFYSWDTNLSISAMSHCNEDDLVLLFSYSGNTRDVVNLQKIGKAKGATTVAITQLGMNPLANLSDYVISIPMEEAEIRLGAIASRTSMFIVTDLLYYSIINSNFNDAMEKLVDTRHLYAENNK